MGTTFKQPGKVIEHLNESGSAISADDIVVMGDTVGVALVDIADDGRGNVSISGVHKGVAKVTGTAWVQGDKLDWDASEEAFGKGITPATGDVTNCGIAAADAASGDATGEVLLTPGTGAVQ